ncbi:MAG: ABC transporter permease [Candidatus Hodarchaeota archaeon]
MIWKNITRRKARSFLTISGVVVGIAAIVFLMSLMEGLETQVTAITERGDADLLVLQQESTDFMLSRVRESNAQRLIQVSGVKEVSSVLVVWTKVEDFPFFIVHGLKVNEFTIEHFEVVEGRKLTEQDEGKILLGEKAASHLKKGLGEEIALLDDIYEIIGFYETGLQFEDSGGVILLNEAQETFDLKGIVSYIAVRIQDIGRLEEIQVMISEELPNIDVEVPAEVVLKQEDLQLLKSATSLVSFAAILFGTIIITNTMIMSFYERTREIGILRALGWRKRSVLMMILKETILLALIGGIIGIIFGIIGSQSLERITLTPITAQINLEHLIWGILSAVFLGLLGGIYPAIRAARMDPIQALGHEV